MTGIYGVVLAQPNPSGLHFPFSNLSHYQHNQYEFSGGVVGRSTLKKCGSDRIFESWSDLTICFEGLHYSNYLKDAQAFKQAYQQEGIAFVKQIEGQFSGFVLDEQRHKLHIFNDHLATKSLFYFHDKKIGFIFSSKLAALTAFLKQALIPYHIDTDGVYQMALYGFLLEDRTYIQEIKKLTFGSLLTVDLNSFELAIQSYHHYEQTAVNIAYPEALSELNRLMLRSVQRCWSKQAQPQQAQLAFLSGGMDARVNALLAKKIGFSNITTLTFGQSGCSDVTYAKSIAQGEGFDHIQRTLVTPHYLTQDIFENYIKPVDGLMMFHTSAHAAFTVKNFNLEPYSVIHTGQLGNLVFGTFNKPRFDFKHNSSRLGYTGFIGQPALLQKIQCLPALLNKYQAKGLDIYSLEQRQINATLYGDRNLADSIDNVSPYFDKSLLKFCFSLPLSYKKNQCYLFDWLSAYHPHILQYPYEKIGMAPNHPLKRWVGLKFKKYVNGARKYFNLPYDSMNPYQRWLLEYPVVLQHLNELFARELESCALDSEIKADLQNIYDADIFEFRNKFAVITVLLALKLHF